MQFVCLNLGRKLQNSVGLIWRLKCAGRREDSANDVKYWLNKRSNETVDNWLNNKRMNGQTIVQMQRIDNVTDQQGR